MLGGMPTAGLVVIGDEILSGKTADTNTPFLIEELRGLGVPLREIAEVLAESDAPPPDPAALRKRYERLKERLVRLAAEEA